MVQICCPTCGCAFEPQQHVLPCPSCLTPIEPAEPTFAPAPESQPQIRPRWWDGHSWPEPVVNEPYNPGRPAKARDKFVGSSWIPVLGQREWMGMGTYNVETLAQSIRDASAPTRVEGHRILNVMEAITIVTSPDKVDPNWTVVRVIATSSVYVLASYHGELIAIPSAVAVAAGMIQQSLVDTLVGRADVAAERAKLTASQRESAAAEQAANDKIADKYSLLNLLAAEAKARWNEAAKVASGATDVFKYVAYAAVFGAGAFGIWKLVQVYHAGRSASPHTISSVDAVTTAE